MTHTRGIGSCTVLHKKYFFLSLLKCDDRCQHQIHINDKEMQMSDFVKRVGLIFFSKLYYLISI